MEDLKFQQKHWQPVHCGKSTFQSKSAQSHRGAALDCTPRDRQSSKCSLESLQTLPAYKPLKEEPSLHSQGNSFFPVIIQSKSTQHFPPSCHMDVTIPGQPSSVPWLLPGQSFPSPLGGKARFSFSPTIICSKTAQECRKIWAIFVKHGGVCL